MTLTPEELETLSEGHPLKAMSIRLVELLDEHYWTPLRNLYKVCPSSFSGPGFLVAPEKIAVYAGRTHLAVEYFGAIEPPSQLPGGMPVEFRYLYNEPDFVQAIIGMQITNTGPRLVTDNSDGFHSIFMPVSGSALTMMMDNGWDITAHEMAFSINCGGIDVLPDDFSRIVNCFFYAEEDGKLRTRHVRWLDFFPLRHDEETETEVTLVTGIWSDSELIVKHDSLYLYPKPRGYEPEKLTLLNRFRELILDPSTHETVITTWLEEAEHQFILKMALGAVRIVGQKLCPWLDGSGRQPVKPDFFAIGPNGYAEILEIKLPQLKGSVVVGTENRKTFSAEVQSYVSQARVYRDYFDNPTHRKYVLDTHEVRLDHPRRILVMGRRWEFSDPEWRSIKAELPDLLILTYDDMIDAATAQIYS